MNRKHVAVRARAASASPTRARHGGESSASTCRQGVSGSTVIFCDCRLWKICHAVFGLLGAACASFAALPIPAESAVLLCNPNMNGKERNQPQSATGAKQSIVGAQKDLREMQSDVSMCRQTIVQLRGMLSELQRKQTEAIADMFKTVVFRINGIKRVDSPSKQS